MKKSSAIIASAASVAVVLVVASILAMLSTPGSQTETPTNDIKFLGEEFSTPIQVASATSELSAHAPAVVVDTDKDIMYVAFVQNAGGAASTQHGGIGIGDLYMKSSTDGGETFSDPVRVNDEEGDVYPDHRVPPRIDVGPNGEVYALWVNTVYSPNLMHGMRNLQFAASTDGAKSFSPPVAIVDENQLAGRSFYGLDVSADGKIYVGWLDNPVGRLENGTLVSDDSRQSTVRFARSVDGGKTFEPSVELPESTDPCPCCNVHVLAGSDNTVLVSWRQTFPNPSGATATIRDIVTARSDDGGQTFTKPTKVSNDNFAYDGCAHVGAPMAMDSKGILHVAWYTGKEGAPGIYYATSSDMGRSFGKPVPIVVGDWVPPSRVDLTIDDKDNAWLAYEYPAELLSGNASYPAQPNEIEAWDYAKASALIQVTKVTPEGEVFKTQQQLNQVDGKVPVIATGRDTVTVIWGSTSNEVVCSSASISA